MEPTAEPAKKNVFTSVTPLSKALALILFVSLPLLALFIGYQQGAEGSRVMVGEAPKTESGVKFRSYTNEDLGFSVLLPEDWSVEQRADIAVSVSSPDFAMQEPVNDREEGREYSAQSGGNILLEHAKNSLDPSIQDPEAYLAFTKQSQKDRTDFVSSERVVVGGTPALLTYSKMVSDKDGSISGVAHVSIPQGADLYSFTYMFSSPSPTTKDALIIQKLIETFRALQ